MGTCYTLIRRDRRIGYDLGKAWELHHVFSSEASSYGSAQPPSMIVTPADIETLAELMAMAMRGDFDEPLTLSLARDHDYEYWHQVAADIVDWSEAPATGTAFGPGGVLANLKLEACPMALDISIVVEYIGPEAEGEVFEATVAGLAVKDC